VVTVDDAYVDLLTVALPVILNAGIPVTLYLATGFVDQGYWLWWDKLRYLIERGQARDLRLQLRVNDELLEIHLSSDTCRLCDQLSNKLVTLPPAEIANVISQLETHFQVRLPDVAPNEYASISWDDVQTLRDRGVLFGSQTHSHQSLTRVSPLEAKRDIEKSIGTFKSNGVDMSEMFCIPHGTPADYSRQITEVIAECGLSHAYVPHHEIHNACFFLSSLRDWIFSKRSMSNH
jgi:peptidoglycan/xylan/chitin deacetylase (PgdA/CDA1 family)